MRSFLTLFLSFLSHSLFFLDNREEEEEEEEDKNNLRKMKKKMEADDEKSFESYSTCFEGRLKAALREMQLGQSFSRSSNTNSKKKNDDDDVML